MLDSFAVKSTIRNSCKPNLKQNDKHSVGATLRGRPQNDLILCYKTIHYAIL